MSREGTGHFPRMGQVRQWGLVGHTAGTGRTRSLRALCVCVCVGVCGWVGVGGGILGLSNMYLSVAADPTSIKAAPAWASAITPVFPWPAHTFTSLPREITDCPAASRSRASRVGEGQIDSRLHP